MGPALAVLTLIALLCGIPLVCLLEGLGELAGPSLVCLGVLTIVLGVGASGVRSPGPDRSDRD